MNFNRDEAHDLKNQLAIAMGMLEISLKYLGKDPIDIIKVTERIEKTYAALKKLNGFLDAKKNPEQT